MTPSAALSSASAHLIFAREMPSNSSSSEEKKHAITIQPPSTEGYMCSRLAFILPICTMLNCLAPATAVAATQADTPPVNVVFAPYFLVNANTESSIALLNLRQDMDVTVTPTLLIGGKPITLSAVTIQPRISTSINIGDELRLRGIQAATGGVSLTYETPAVSGAISAEVLIDDERANIYLSSVAIAREEFMGTDLDAVIWSPDGDARAFVAIVNTTDAPRQLMVTSVGSRGAVGQDALTIPAYTSRTVTLDGVLQSRHSKATGVGLRVSFTGHPGDVIAEAFVYNKHTAFSKHIHFVDRTMHFESVALRTHFALLGSQPSGQGYPEYAVFRSVAVIRNFDSRQTVTVTPVLRTDEGTSPRYIALTPVQLSPDSSKIIDLSAFKKTGLIPSDVHQASVRLDLTPSENLVVAELFNYDSVTGGYVVGPSLTAHPARSSVSLWRTDSGFDTDLIIENTSTAEDSAAVSLRTATGYKIDRVISLAPGELRRLRVSVLQQRQQGDDVGFPVYGSEGTIAVSGSHGTDSRLVVERLIHSPAQAEYVGLPSEPCIYVTDIDGYFAGDSSPLQSRGTVNWSDGSTTDEAIVAYSTTNSSLAQVNGSDSVYVDTSQPEGSTATVGESKVATSCGNCSYMTHVSFPFLAFKRTFYTNVSGAPPFCFYSSTACSSGTPTCTAGVGFRLEPPVSSCTAYAQATWLVGVTGAHYACLIARSDSAGGPGACS